MPKNVKGGLLGFFIIHPVAKYQKNGRGPFGDFKKSHKAEKGAGKSHSAEKLE